MSSIVENVKKTAQENFGGAAHNVAQGSHQFGIEDVPDLTGKTAVITGASDGIGFATLHTLLSHNIKQVHMISASQEKADKAMQEVRSELGESYADRLVWHGTDMSDWRTVQKVGCDIAARLDRLDILVNNAARGIMTHQIADNTGLDRHMSVNHFGHVVLVTTLLPLLKKTANNGHIVRISNQSSNAHQAAPEPARFESRNDLNKDYGPNGQYGLSKLAQILYSRYLDAHLTRQQHLKILVNATHPGVVDTDMSSRQIHETFPVLGYAMSTLLKPLKKNIWEGAASTLYAATKTEKSGEYICPPATPEPGSVQSQDKGLGEQLMKLTREVLCDYFKVEKWDDY